MSNELYPDETKVDYFKPHWTKIFHDVSVGVAALVFIACLIYISVVVSRLNNAVSDFNNIDLFPTSSPSLTPCTYPIADCPKED